MKLQELIEAKIKILREKKTKDGSMTILAPWIVTGRKNQNGRLYPYNLIHREIARVQTKIKAGALISSADHPQGALTSLADASHIIRKLEIDKDGKGWMEATILPTTKGRNVMTIIKAGGQLGISARGAGTLNPSGTVNDDYRLLGIDFCTSPSEPEAVFNKSNVCESISFEEDEDPELDKNDIAKEMKRRAELEETLVNLMSESFSKAVADNMWYGDFESYKKRYGKGLREVMGLDEPSEGIKQAEQKVTEQAVKERLYSHYEEALKAGFRGTFSQWKEKYPRLVEQAEKGIKISEQKAKPKEPFVAKISWSEAQASGFTGTVEEYREQYPNIELMVPAPPQKPLVETLTEEATRIYTGLKKENPNSVLKLEHVRDMLIKELEPKRERKLREFAIRRVNASLEGCGSAPSQQLLAKMIEDEIAFIREQRAEKKRKNWQAYKRLLSD